MKKLLVLFIVSCMLMTLLASCGPKEGNPTEPNCTEHVDADGDYVCDKCEAELKQPEVPPSLKPCDEHKDEDGDYACDDCGHVMYEDVEYELNVSDLEIGVREENDINGNFTILAGTEVRQRTKTYNEVEYTKSIKINPNSSKIMVNVPGTGKLSFLVQNGSTGTETQFIKVIAPDGTEQDIEFPGESQSNPLVMIEVDVTEGVWVIARGKNGGTQDIFYLNLACTVETAPENGFELVATGKTDFLQNTEFNTDGVRLNATFENGKTEAIKNSDVTIDTSAVDMTKSGTYEVKISYKDYTPITYKVKVYAPQTIELNYDLVEKLSKGTSAGNGVYFNYSFKEVYNVGEAFDEKGLSVIVVGKCGDDELKFRISDYTIAGFDSATEGAKELTISYGGLEAKTNVYVVGGEAYAHVKVDKLSSVVPGTVVDGYPVFTTIQQALDYLARVDAATPKTLEIGEGLYTEKIEITIPYLTIKGAGADKTTIEWDSLHGLLDTVGGFTHTTDSTQTVAVREQAINCVIEGLTISNYWNSQERMDEAGLAIERGLALLVQADRFIMKDSALLGIQDTLELFYGRQYFENVFISGYTDFIFGSNNTTYFKNCTIHVIDTEKDDKGTAGYITAFKGNNKDANDAVLYGAIFDECNFTADEGVTTGCTAIGRPWGTHAAVAIINSELGGHISTKGYTGGKNERYISMTAKPTDETVKYVEYNNTGAGALTEVVAGMRMLTAEEAANYSDFAVIFGTTNGKVTYLDPWDPTSNEVEVDDRIYYFFNGESSATGTSYTYDQSLQGVTGTIGGIAIDATVGKVVARGSDTQMNKGAKLTFNVEAGTLVTVVSYPGYGYYTLNGVEHNANDTFSQYYAEDTEVVLLVTGTAYLYRIIIDPNAEAPEAPTISEIKVEGMNLNYTVGDELLYEGAVVKAYYSDYSISTITDYTVDASAVNQDAAGSYEVVFSFGGMTSSVTVVYEAADADPAITENLVLDFTTQDGVNAINNNNRVTIEAVPEQYYFNNGNSRFEGTISFMVKAGAKITVTPYHDANYVSYTIGALGEEELTTYTSAYTYEAESDCTIVITGLSGNYFCSIQIVYPAGKENVSVTFGSEGNYKEPNGVVDLSGVNVVAHGTNNCQVKEGSIKITLYAGATLTIYGYPNYTDYVLNDGINEITVNKDVPTHTEYVYTATMDTIVTITITSGNNYFYGIDITYQ